ncbi:NucA/NucB deoxyribonuclease domain-containing protein [Streptomyces sp. NPDC054863]
MRRRQLPRIAWLQTMRLPAIAASVTAALAISVLPAAAVPPPTPAPSIAGKIEVPRALGGDAWHPSDSRRSATAEGRATVPLKELAEARRKAVLTSAGTATPAPAKDSRSMAPGDYDYFTREQCRKYTPGGLNESRTRIKNHFAFCQVAKLTYSFFLNNDPTQKRIGAYTFRLTVIGRGQRNAPQMEFDATLDKWKGYGRVDPNAPLTMALNCLNAGAATCAAPIGSRTDSITNWRVQDSHSARFDTSLSPHDGNLVFYPQDRVNHHQLQVALTGGPEGGTVTYEQPFRCDAASYLYGTGGCIFHTVEAVLHYSTSDKRVKGVAKHIKLAQNHPDRVYPRWGEGVVIPGGKKSGKPLTRLVPGVDVEARRYYDANNADAQFICRWNDPDFSDPTKQCDEYPFRSTWEGANYVNLHPSEIWRFSARMVDGTQNGNAGSDLAVWYGQDRILAKDAFWVQIDD